MCVTLVPPPINDSYSLHIKYFSKQQVFRGSPVCVCVYTYMVVSFEVLPALLRMYKCFCSLNTAYKPIIRV